MISIVCIRWLTLFTRCLALFLLCIAVPAAFASSPTRIKTFSDRDEVIKLALASNTEWNFSYRVISVNRLDKNQVLTEFPVQIFRLNEKSFFNHDRFDLKLDGAKVLERIGRIFSTFDAHIIIVGHTDDTGAVGYNEILANRRAETVYERLIGLGFDQRKLQIIAMGEAQPIADNNTDAGRAFNRRVEFFIADQFEIARLGVEKISPNACHFQDRAFDGSCQDRAIEVEVVDPTGNQNPGLVQVQTGKPQPLEFNDDKPKLLVPREIKKPPLLVPRRG